MPHPGEAGEHLGHADGQRHGAARAAHERLAGLLLQHGQLRGGKVPRVGGLGSLDELDVRRLLGRRVLRNVDGEVVAGGQGAGRDQRRH